MTGLLFSEDIQLDIPSHWRTTSQLVLEEGGGVGTGRRRSFKTAGTTEAARSLVSEGD